MRRKSQATEPKPFRLIRHRTGVSNLIGYARVSTREQHLDVQLGRLQLAGCSRVYAEKITGSGPRPGWDALRDDVRAGDVVIVLRVDRMGRRLSELVRSMDALRDAGVHVRSLEEGIDTSARGGRFAFNVIASLAEKVRDDIRENTRAGLAELRKKGVRLGRPSKLEPVKVAQVAHLRAQGYSLRAIGRATHLGKTTVTKALELASHLRGDPRQMPLPAVDAR